MKNNIKLSDATMQALESVEAQALYSELRAEGYDLFITKKEYADIIGSSVSTVNHYIIKGYGCPYKKMGKAKSAKVLFSLIDVANYLSTHTIHTA